MKNQKVMLLTRSAITAALYVALTFASYPLSFGAVQFRVSELMILLCFIDPLYIPGLTIGCFIANLLGPFGLVDAAFGSFSTLVCAGMVALTAKYMGRKLFSLIIASLWSSVFSFIIAFEIVFIAGAKESFLFWVVWVAVGEFVVITLLGVPLYQYILKKENLTKLLKFTR